MLIQTTERKTAVSNMIGAGIVVYLTRIILPTFCITSRMCSLNAFFCYKYCGNTGFWQIVTESSELHCRSTEERLTEPYPVPDSK